MRRFWKGRPTVATEKTYPCVVGNRIVELTEAQRAAVEWRRATSEEKIGMLLERIETLEETVKRLQEPQNG